MQPSGHEALPDGAAPGEAIPPPVSDRISPAPTGGSCPPPSIPDHQLFHLIGRGSYGQVWLARNRLGTPRAVKIVSREAFEDRKPFEREFKGIQRFEPVSRAHEGLVDILQVGGTEDYFYYVMELADDAGSQRSEVRSQESERGPCGGPPVVSDPHLLAPDSYSPRTLRVAQQQSGGRLPVRDCVRIGRLLASALAHLHRHNLVHRDVKPSNVIFVEGLPKLADIGLVADVSEARSFVGTEGFIPPEGPGTPRADLYSLGKVLYEISTGLGRREFPALPDEFSPQASADRAGPKPARQSEIRNPKSEIEQVAFLELNAVITKACQADPAQRYTSAEAMETDLALLEQGRSVRRQRSRQRQWAIARVATFTVLALALAGVGLHQLRQTRGIGGAAAERASIFVLPFRHSAPGPLRREAYETDQDVCLCGRLTDAFIDGLALVPGIRTGPRKSGWVRHDEDQVRRDLAQTNNVRYILTGRVDHTNEALRVALRLYARKKETPLWMDTFTATTNEVITLEQQGIAAIAHRLRLSITEPAQRQIDQTLSNSLAAYRLLLRARSLYILGFRKDYKVALRTYDEAKLLDRRYAAARIGVIMVRGELGFEVGPQTTMLNIETEAKEALALDDTLVQAYVLIAHKRIYYDYDWKAAERDVEWMVATLPEENLETAIWLRTLGRTNEARVYHERLEHEPAPTLFQAVFIVLGELV